MESDPYHYPPDLLSLLVDTIPLLRRSTSEFADTSIEMCKKALSQKTFVLAELREIVYLLERDGNFAE